MVDGHSNGVVSGNETLSPMSQLPPLCTPNTAAATAKALYKLVYHAQMSAIDKDARFVADQIAAFLEGDISGSLDGCLGFRSHGGVTLRRAVANENRDHMLRFLASTYPEWNGRDPRQVAREMRKAFERYESGRWLRERHHLAAPSAEPYATFWRVLKGKAPMPKLYRLREILANERPSGV